MKDIKGYEGLYAITSCGKVWSYRSQKFLQSSLVCGYLSVCLCKGGEQKRVYIHRLVAEAYIPNPNNLPQVNHKDEIKIHNYINNLEWVTEKENCNYGTRTERGSDKRKKPIYCVELDKIYDSLKQASEELLLNQGNISKACRGKIKTCGGYHWRYIDMK